MKEISEEQIKKLKIRFDELSAKGILNLTKEEHKELQSICSQFALLRI